ncbi:MAG: WG repeat-containing protein [Ruminococcaceae bacterium]|nr:WG repeat-containing protein [Oscillospiraceae bacterium]
MYEPIYLSKDGTVKTIYSRIYDDYGHLYAYFITDQKGYVVRKHPDDPERTQVAVCNIMWQDDAEWLDKIVDTSMSSQENEAAQKKAILECWPIISDWYDNLNWSKDTVDCGYYLVSKGGKWGFISIDTGEEVLIADDASDFNNGYAVVTNNGKGHIVDKDFNIVSEEFDCTSASVSGEYFVVKQGEKTILLEVKE